MHCAGAVRPSQPEFSTRQGRRLEKVGQDSSLIGQLKLRHDSRLKRLAKYCGKLHSNGTYPDQSAELNKVHNYGIESACVASNIRHSQFALALVGGVKKHIYFCLCFCLLIDTHNKCGLTLIIDSMVQ